MVISFTRRMQNEIGGLGFSVAGVEVLYSGHVIGVKAMIGPKSLMTSRRFFPVRIIRLVQPGLEGCGTLNTFLLVRWYSATQWKNLG